MHSPSTSLTTSLCPAWIALCLALFGFIPCGSAVDLVVPPFDPGFRPAAPAGFPIQQSPLVNDLFENRLTLTGNLIALTSNNSGARTEPEEPVAGGQLVETLWWSWTATETGAVRISLSHVQAGALPNLGVFRGESLATLESVPAAGDIFVSAGDTLHVAVGAPGGPFQLNVVFRVPPPPAINDHFTNRLTITHPDYQYSANMAHATLEPDETYRIPGGPASVWWQFDPPQNGLLVVTRLESLFSPFLELFETNSLAGASSPHPVAKEGHSVWAVRAGQSYVLRMSSSWLMPSDFDLATRFFTAPANDHFADRQQLGASNQVIRLWMFNASMEPGEPRPRADARESIWWSWAAPEDGQLIIPNLSLENIVFGLYQGPAVNQLQRIQHREYFDDLNTGMQWPVRRGQVYHLQFAVPPGLHTPVHFTLQFQPYGVAVTDHFHGARLLEGPAARSTESVIGATREPGEPEHRSPSNEAHKSIWWRWIQPHSGRATFRNLYGSLRGVTLVAYRGNRLEALQRVGSGTDFLVVDGLAGDIYHVAAEVPVSQDGTVELRLSMPDPSFTLRPVPGNLVLNPSFEHSGIGAMATNWTEGPGFGGVVTPGGVDGHHRLTLVTGTVEQDIPTEPGQTYRIRLAVAGTEYGDGDVDVSVAFGDLELGVIQYTLDHTRRFWHWREYTAVAATNSTRLAISSRGIYVGLDQVSVVSDQRPPVLTTPPHPVTTFAGGSVVLVAGFSGTEPMGIQWFHDNVPLGWARDGLIRWEEIAPTNAGAYHAVASNAWGTAVTQPVSLTVEVADSPQIILQPESATVVPGQYHQLTVAAVGTPPLRYQWWRNGVAQPGATNRSLAMAQVSDSDFGSWVVVVRNGAESVTSLPANLVPAPHPPTGGATLNFSAWMPVGTVSVDTPVFDIDGRTLLMGSRYLAQLYAGSDADSLRPVGQPRTFLEGFNAGYWHPDFITLPHVAPGESYVAQVRAWDGQAGTSYEEARALGGRFGRSELISMTGAEMFSDPEAFLQELPRFQLRSGLPSFSVGRIDAEPSAQPGWIRFRLTGAAGFRYLLERRVDGANWVPVEVFDPFDGEVVFEIPANEASSVLFRARILN